MAYTAFVEGSLSADKLLYSYYYTCLTNRFDFDFDFDPESKDTTVFDDQGNLVIHDKQQLYDLIANWHLVN